jgi:hypothetical protein
MTDFSNRDAAIGLLAPGAFTGRQWPRLDSEAALVALPEPEPAVLLAAGALVLLLVRRRRRA